MGGMMETPMIVALFTAPDFATPNTLFVFGAFLILGVLGAMLAHAVKWMPTITAFMLLGAVIGPHGSGIVDEKILADTSGLIDVALALILFKLGQEVQLRHLLRSTSLWRVSVTEALLTFGAVFSVIVATTGRWLVGTIVAAVTVSSSPAVLVHMADETGTRGPAIYRAKALLTLNNVLSFFLFSLFLPFVLDGERFVLIDILGIPLYRMVGAVVVGWLMAALISRIDRWLISQDEHYRFALIIGGLTIVVGLSNMLNVSSLFAALTLGIGTKWLEKQRQGLSSVDLGPGGDVFFIVLFVIAGANLHFSAVGVQAGLIAGIVLLRFGAKVLAFATDREGREQGGKIVVATGLMLLPMGALAIGLGQTTMRFSVSMGEQVLPLVFGLVAVLETLGPFAVSLAFRMTGESAVYRNAAAAAKQAVDSKEEGSAKPEGPSPETLPLP
jgi:NhaP-type Na+/H+ or K+/H+ antiporter